VPIELLYTEASTCDNTPVLAFNSSLFISCVQGLPLKVKSQQSLGGPVEIDFANGHQKTAINSLLQRTVIYSCCGNIYQQWSLNDCHSNLYHTPGFTIVFMAFVKPAVITRVKCFLMGVF